MNITANRLTATAGLCAAAAGAIFIGVQINHPPADVAHVVTTEMAVRESAKVLMCVLALIGFTGMFLRHHRRFGVLGLAGFSLLTVGYLAMFAVQCIVAYVLPTVAHSTRATSRTTSTRPSVAARAATSATCRSCSSSPASATRSVVCCSASRCSAPACWPAGPACCSPRHHLRPRAVRAAGVLQPPVRGAHRRRADRPRRLAVARAPRETVDAPATAWVAEPVTR